ncbi:MAG: hypothetical protein A3A77_03995 [Candidatus Blackburnbacteria bacterium RIFCSPLOWO2_01_FULL_40_20]|uniref:IS630 family transposase n=1 Tax=Candidatus Blackburnbacteria bacterium RIFCSPLOWO2_01_FULL_40_20 TaxID=1797519 RepID=A0A1G1VCD6_9BACT|nr:MAG: hypothetical protein A3A77_03995 [Candidatus Blackburnbacteria bacterium RIFCSPLOWO2_01_FULL_40_20]
MPKFLTYEEFVSLKQLHRSLKNKKAADRVKVLIMLHLGFTPTQISQALMLDETTLSRYVKTFKEKGVEGLLEVKYTGGKTRLTLCQEQELKVYLKENITRTAKEVVDYIFLTYKVNYSIIGTTKLLHRLGFTWKKPKIVPGKANKEKQEEFLKTYNSLKESLNINDQIYFLDSTHPEHNTKPSYGWILKGKANDKFVKTNTGRERLNLNGALNFQGKVALVLDEETINKKATIHLLETIKEKQKKGKVYLVLDNASHHHAKEVKRWVLHHPRFKLVFLPVYSPNLNLIERLWRFFHNKVTYNHYFETFKEFRDETLKFFKNLKQYDKELSTLLTDNFQLVPT